MNGKLILFSFLIFAFGATGLVFAQERGEPSKEPRRVEEKNAPLRGEPSTEKAPEKSVPKTISGGIVNGKAVSLPKPEYPAAARAVRASGAVNVQVTIDENGNVISAAAVSGHPLLRSAAVNAARQAKFAPTYLSGQAVKVTGVIVYNFTLPPETNSKTNSKSLLPLTISMFLTLFKEVPLDEDAADILYGFSESMPENYALDRKKVDELIDASKERRQAIIDGLIGDLKKRNPETDQWSFDIGKHWGEAVSQAFVLIENDYRGDRREFTKSLEALNWLLESPPNDVSPEVLDKIRKLSVYNGEVDTISEAFIKDFLKSSLELIGVLVKEFEGK